MYLPLPKFCVTLTRSVFWLLNPMLVPIRVLTPNPCDNLNLVRLRMLTEFHVFGQKRIQVLHTCRKTKVTLKLVQYQIFPLTRALVIFLVMVIYRGV